MKFDPSRLIGLMEQEVAYLTKAYGLSYRVTKKDGKAFIITRDYKTDRVNLEFENGKVIRATIG